MDCGWGRWLEDVNSPAFLVSSHTVRTGYIKYHLLSLLQRIKGRNIRVRVVRVRPYKRQCWSFWIKVLEKNLDSPLDRKEIQPVHSKGNQSWVFIGRTDAKTEAPVLWPPDAKNWLIGKVPDTGKDWKQEEKRVAKEEMVGVHHWFFSGHELEQTLGESGGQGSLVCCTPRHHKEFQKWLSNWTTTLVWDF